MSDSPSHLKHLDDKLAAGLRRDRALRWVVVIIAVFAMAMSGAGLLIVAKRADNTAGRIDKVEPKAATAKARADVAADKATATDDRLSRNVTQTKRIVRFLQGKQGLPGVRGANDKIGAPGPQGPAGRPPTAAEIRAAVDAYCGPSGCKGDNGDSVSRADILAAITSYCAQNSCRGPSGTDGKDGADGAPGRDGTDGAPPPGSFSATFPEFVVNCIDVGANTAGGRSYTCSSTSTAPTQPVSP